MRLGALFALLVLPAFAHRLDEYLQGTLISIEKDRVEAEMTLTPGIAVSSAILTFVDTNADGVISGAEQRAYAARVLHDLSLSIDGRRLTPHLLSIRFPATDEMKEGRGEIQLVFGADLPPGGRNRNLILENHHQSRISAYQVNSLVPRDPDIRIAAQVRNVSQSVYQLRYEQTGTIPWASFLWLGGPALLLLSRFVFLFRFTPTASARPMGCGSVKPLNPSRTIGNMGSGLKSKKHKMSGRSAAW